MPRPPRILTPGQQAKINELVRLQHQALVVELLGDKSVPRSILTQIKAKGLYRKPRPDVIRRAFQHGREGVVNSAVLDMNAEEFDRYLVKKGDYLTTDERTSLEVLRESFVNYTKSLAEGFAARVNDVLTKANKQLQRALRQKKRPDLFSEVERRKALAEVAKGLAQATEIQLSYASRTVTTETNNAYQDGRASEILRKSGEADPYVFKRPRHDACLDCIRAYLNEDGVTPRVFRLSELIANGSNVGKSHAERLPVLDSFHPWCFVEDTLVTTTRGKIPIQHVQVGDLVLTHNNRLRRVVQTHKNPFSGRLHNINGTFTTAFHPFLTLRGWVPAEGLQSGDYIIHQDVDIAGVQVDNCPSPTSEQFIFLTVLSLFFKTCMPSTIDFYREFVFAGAEVDIKAAYSQLWRKGYGLRTQDCVNGFFEIGKQPFSLNYFSSFLESFERSFRTFSGFVSCLNTFHSLLGAHKRMHINSGFASGSPMQAVVGHIPGNGPSTNTQLLRHFEHRETLFVMHVFEQLFRKIFSSHTHFASAIPRMYSGTKSMCYHKGSVYNLSVWEDESYIANNHVVHNCACEISWLPPGFTFGGEGQLVYKKVKSA